MGTSEITADSIASEIPAAFDTNIPPSWNIASKFSSLFSYLFGGPFPIVTSNEGELEKGETTAPTIIEAADTSIPTPSIAPFEAAFVVPEENHWVKNQPPHSVQDRLPVCTSFNPPALPHTTPPYSPSQLDEEFRLDYIRLPDGEITVHAVRLKMF